MPRLREPPKQEEEEKPVVAAGAEQQEEQPEVVTTQDDRAAEELRQQVETLRRSEQAARQETANALAAREQAINYARQREAELNRSRKETSDSRLEAIQNGMAAAEAEAEEAKRALRLATIEQDVDAQIAAQERLTEAKANLINLTNGKTMLEQQIQQAEEQAKFQAQQAQQRQQQAQQGDQLDRTDLPQTAKNWLRAHPEYLTDLRKNAKIQSLHWDVIDEGHAPFSDAYYASLEQHLGLRSKPAVRQNAAEEDEVDEEPTRTIVSAPVSRSAPSTGTRTSNPKEIRLTASQKEAAKMAGITEVEYAKQLIKMNQEKANGNYGGAP